MRIFSSFLPKFRKTRGYIFIRNTLIFLCIFTIFISHLNLPEIIYADEEAVTEIEQELAENIINQLGSLDLSDMEQLIDQLTNVQSDIFGNSSFISKVENVINGEFKLGQKSIFSSILNLIFDDILKFIPLLASIVVIAIVCGFISNLKGENNSKSIGDIIHFLCYGVIIILIMGGVVNLINITTDTLNLLKEQMEIIFPILLTIMSAVGGTASVAVYQPAVALLSSFVMQVFTSVLMPIFIFMLIFTIISNLTSTIKLDKFTKFLGSTFKWILGGIFTIFMAFLAIQGITASTYDGVSIRTAKYAMRSYIPLLGGYLSEGFDVILASSVLIKNAIGASGLFLMFAMIISPIIQVVVFSLVLKLAAAILEPLTDNRISEFIYSIAKTLTLLVVMILGVAFMYIITVGLIMCTANFV
ncbi:MAG: stage III sporulation protein AE [Clostridia bacterium]|nr:stage III sporulation protein AE [Clostridia bacterium]